MRASPRSARTARTTAGAAAGDGGGEDAQTLMGGEGAGAGELAGAPAGAAASPVTYERRGAAALVTIDRQERRNAVDGPTARELHAAYRRFEADDEARVMVLTGAGGVAFCAGADLKALVSFGDRLTAPEGPMGFTRLTPSKPTIAAISGFALAGGLELALWCDLRIATEDSRLGFPERRWGVPLIDGGTQRLPRVVGLGRALDIILTGRIMDANEAHAIGLVNELVPPGRHLERALELAENLARFPQRTMLADRQAAIHGLGLPLHDGLTLESQAGPDVYEDAIAGAARFAAGEGRGGAGAGA
jgi:enoyl-CoA hydratase